MLTYLTRNKLANFLLVLNEGERQIEVIRQILCEQEFYEPYAAFKRIDRHDNGVINAADVVKFLADNKVHHSERSCHLFIQRYDNDGDGALGYKEFLQAVLTLENAVLRAVTTQRPNYEVAPHEYLVDDIEYALTKVIDREINFYLDLDDHRKELLESQDFSYAAAYSCIDKYSTGIIDYDNLKAFFKNQSIYPGDEEIIAILRRLDRDDDGLISFSEFVETMEPVDPVLKATANRRNASSRFESPKKVERDSQFNASIRTSSPLRKIATPSQGGSPLRRASSPTRNIATPAQAGSPLKREASPLRREASPSKITSANKAARSYAYPSNSFTTASEKNLAQSQSQSINDRQASPIKRQASPLRKEVQREASNFTQAHRDVSGFSPAQREVPSFANTQREGPSFTNTQREAPTFSPVKREISTFTSVQQSPVRRPNSNAEILLNQSIASGKASPLRRVVSPGSTRLNESFGNQSGLLSPDLNEGGTGLRKGLLYKEFPTSQPRSPVKLPADDSAYVGSILGSTTRGRFEAQTPEKRSTTKGRLSSASKSVKKGLQFDENVSHYILIQTLKQFIILDKDLEVAKQDLTLKSDFNLLDFFRTFDQANCGSVSVKDLEAGLIRYGIYPNREELSLFFRKIDTDNDGLLRFTDFADAFTPKQKEYSNLLHNRTPSNIDCIVDLNRVFSQDTRNKAVNVLKLFLENEGSSESLRQRLKSKGEMSGHEAFKYLDLKGDGFITSEEIFGVFQENDSYLTEREVKLLMDRLDQDRDGQVSYYELLQEISPKTQ